MNNAKHTNKIIPSTPPISSLSELNINLSFSKMNSNTVKNNEKGISFQIVLLVTVNGNIIPDIPKIKYRLNMLDPIILPNTTSLYPDALAITFTIISGIDVPKATIVNPTVIWEILYFTAIDDEPSTSRSAPFVRKANPNTIRIKLNTIPNVALFLRLFVKRNSYGEQTKIPPFLIRGDNFAISTSNHLLFDLPSQPTKLPLC